MIIGEPIRTVVPTALPVSLAELKAHTRLDGLGDGDDAYLAGLIRAATEYVEQYTGLGLITQTWTQTFSAFAAKKTIPMVLRRRPLQEVLSVAYLDIAAADQTLGTSIYRVAGIGSDKAPGAIWQANGQAWPTVLDAAEAVTVTYTVGFGDDHNAVPELIRHAIMMVAGTLHAFREDFIMGSSIAELPISAKNLLRDWRPLAVA